VDAADSAFADGEGGYFTTAADATDVPLTRPRVAQDNATPSGIGIMAEVLARLYHLTGDANWRGRTEAVLRSCSGDPRRLSGMPSVLAAADLLEEAASVVVVGSRSDPRTQALLTAALAAPDPAVVVVQIAETQGLNPAHPAYGRSTVAGAPAAYLCRRSVCSLPVSDPEALRQMLRTRSSPSAS
jgi:uncharacterized protein YyaL (SSP411 family)